LDLQQPDERSRIVYRGKGAYITIFLASLIL
jgi:hypothetical protein